MVTAMAVRMVAGIARTGPVPVSRLEAVATGC